MDFDSFADIYSYDGIVMMMMMIMLNWSTYETMFKRFSQKFSNVDNNIRLCCYLDIVTYNLIKYTLTIST